MKIKENRITAALISFFSDPASFRFVFIATMFFASLCLVRDWFYIAAGIEMGWAIILFIVRYLRDGLIHEIRFKKLILLFLGFALLTCILHVVDNFFINLYYLLFISICFFFFGGSYAGRDNKTSRREADIILEFIVAATTVVMIAGLVLLALYPKGFRYGGDSFAIHENRFVGIIFNANVTGFYALAAVISANLLISIRKGDKQLNVPRIIYYFLTAAINLTAMFLSDSNDSLLMLMAYVCFVAFYIIFRGYDPGVANFIIRMIAFILSCLVIVAVMLSVRTLVQEGVTSLMKTTEPETRISTGVTASNGRVTIKSDTESHSTTFQHQNTNLDSGRFVIWRQSVQMFRIAPIFGIGKANIVEYGKRFLGGLRYEDFHNGLMTIAVSYGTVGLSLFMIFAICVAKIMLKALFRFRKENKNDGRALTYIVAFCAGYVVYSLFEVALLVDLSYRVLIFWMLIGLGLSYSFKYEENALKASKKISKRSRSIMRISKYLAKKDRL